MAKENEFGETFTVTDRNDDRNQAQGNIPYDPTEFRNVDVGDDPEAAISSDRLIAAHANPDAMAGTDANRVMSVGTGGMGIWERSWSKMIGREIGETDAVAVSMAVDFNPTTETEKLMRAMTFAKDASAPYDAAQRDLGMAIYRHTNAAQQQRQRMQEQFDAVRAEFEQKSPEEKTKWREGLSDEEVARIRDSMEGGLKEWQAEREKGRGLEDDVAAFVERNPDNWHERLDALHQVSDHAVELGTHLTMVGLRDGDEDLVRTGRRIMADAVQSARETVQDHGDLGGMATMWQRGTDPRNDDEERANLRASYVQTMMGRFNPDNLAGHESRRFVAEAVAAHDMGALYDQNVHTLHEMGAKEGGPPSWMRTISDKVFKYKIGDVADRTTDALASQDTNQIREAYQSMEAFRRALLDTADAGVDPDFQNAAREENNRIAARLDQLLAQGVTQEQLADAARAMAPQADQAAAGPAAELRREIALMAEASLQAAAHKSFIQRQDDDGRWNDAYWMRLSNIRTAAGLSTIAKMDEPQR